MWDCHIRFAIVSERRARCINLQRQVVLLPGRAATATWALKVAECIRGCRRAITVVLYIGIRPIVMTSQHTYKTVDLNGTTNILSLRANNISPNKPTKFFCSSRVQVITIIKVSIHKITRLRVITNYNVCLD